MEKDKSRNGSWDWGERSAVFNMEAREGFSSKLTLNKTKGKIRQRALLGKNF